MFLTKSKSSSAKSEVSLGDWNNLYVFSSEFINRIEKKQISGPVAARPMGDVDITSCDVICRGAGPTMDELKKLRRAASRTASFLGIRKNSNIERSIVC
ncbi:hypothetical protein GGI07_002640 [Coemansia sp. Benny D115]|nr:hypothetical protein GGI07_002640 [Coemansia sp. Benny D115]